MEFKIEGSGLSPSLGTASAFHPNQLRIATSDKGSQLVELSSIRDAMEHHESNSLTK